MEIQSLFDTLLHDAKVDLNASENTQKAYDLMITVINTTDHKSIPALVMEAMQQPSGQVIADEVKNLMRVTIPTLQARVEHVTPENMADNQAVMMLLQLYMIVMSSLAVASASVSASQVVSLMSDFLETAASDTTNTSRSE